MSDADKNG